MNLISVRIVVRAFVEDIFGKVRTVSQRVGDSVVCSNVTTYRQFGGGNERSGNTMRDI
jgi:hypothetical protein